MSDQAPTPETDSNTYPADVFCGTKTPVVHADFARRLERERNHWRDEALEQARLLGKGGEREARLIAERDKAQAELAEWHDAAKHVDSDHPDEVHCGCVPILRKQLADVRLSLKHAMEAECAECATFKAERDQWRAVAQGLADAVAGNGSWRVAFAKFDKLKGQKE
jgi:hypothetical protein